MPWGLLSNIRLLLRVPTEDSELIQSQVRVFSKQVPLLYAILLCNTLAVTHTFYGVAPPLLTVVLPVGMATLCLLRLCMWARSQGKVIADSAAARQLRLMVALGTALGVVFTAWGISLFPYGDAYAQGHVAFFMGITSVSCVFCLMHLRLAALLITTIVVVPFTSFLFMTGRPVFMAIALNLLLVAIAMAYILLVYSKNFASMIRFQTELVAKQQETLQLSDENFRLANLDPLTGLANRRQFLSNLQTLLDEGVRDNKRFVVGLIDLDGFKLVNDLYGHVAGDKVLAESAQRLKDAVNGEVSFARLGGDEFGFLVGGDLADSELAIVGELICSALQVPFLVSGIDIQIGASVGFARFPDAGSLAEQLFERSDCALYHAKQSITEKWVIFSSEHETEIYQTALVEQNLRLADLQSELNVHFQPIFDVRLGKLVAYEALARWDSPQLGRVAPDVFIRVAERSDLISKLTFELLRKSLRSARSWPSDVNVSFNLSVRDIVSKDTILNIISIVHESGVAPRRISFEVTETALMRDFDQALESLELLKRLGSRISLDDFGTGYSSLSYVHRLPLDRIKIDRSFVQDIENEARQRDIVKSVIDLCRNLGLECVVEGVETASQTQILQQLGCNRMQGYFFSKPVPSNDALSLIATLDRTWSDYLNKMSA